MEYKNKDADHVEWVKVLKEVYVPGLRDYVKAHYPLGPVWSTTGKTAAGPPPPQPPSASLFTSATPQPSSSRPKEGMSAVFAEISSGKPVTSGNPFHCFMFAGVAEFLILCVCSSYKA